MRLIDAVSLSEGIELHRKSTDQKCEMDRQWAVGYNAGLDRALYSIAYAKTITPPPNAPLTLEELREMDREPIWCRVGPGQWGIINKFVDKVVFFNGGTIPIAHLEGRAYRRKPEEPTP